MFEERGWATGLAAGALGTFLCGVAWRRWRDARAGEASNGHLRGAFGKLPIGMVVKDSSGRILETNPALRGMLGYGEGELRGMSRRDLTHPEDVENDARLFEKLVRGEHENVQIEKRYLKRDGDAFWGRLHAARVKQEGDGAAFAVGAVEDIDERKKAEEALRASERRFRTVIEQAPMSMHIFTPDGTSLLSNRSWDELWDFGEGEGKKNVFEDEQLIEVGLLEYIRESIERGPLSSPPLFYHPARHGRRGVARWLEASVYPVRGDRGSVEEMVLILEEVTGREEARGKLARSEERFRSMVQSSSDVVTILDLEGVVLYQSPSIKELLGYGPDELLGKQALGYVHPEDARAVRGVLYDAIKARGESALVEYRFRHKDGSWRYLETAGSLLTSGEGPVSVLLNSRDVTGRRKTEEELRMLQRAVNSSFNGVLIIDATEGAGGPIIYVNRGFERITGYPAEEVLGRDPSFLQAGDFDQPALDELRHAVRENREWRGEFRSYRKDGSLFWQEHSVAPVRDATGRVVNHVGVINDITDRKHLEDRLAYQAFHDGLTGLANRALFMDRLGHALERAERDGERVAVVFVDLDNFKVVNDSLGHETGDELLVEVAGRIASSLGPGDTAARLGGDEFAVLLENLPGVGEAGVVSDRISEALKAPISVGGRDLYATASIGIAFGPGKGGHVQRAEDLLRDADVAMYEAKRRGKNRYQVFEAGMRLRITERLGLENDLRRALTRDEFQLYYQPKIDLRNGKVSGVEALVRWDRPGAGITNPSEFVPLAEETGLVVPLGSWVLKEACRQAEEWMRGLGDDALEPFTVWVNLSARQFAEPGLVMEVSEILRESGLGPENLGLEVTESALMEHGPGTLSALHGLKALGVKLALDDFGTGYSSLSYLKRLPVDALKIDRSFVASLGRNPEDEVLVSAMIDLAQALGLRVVAEGVELPEQLDRLARMNCDFAQGFHLARPLPVEVASTFLRSNL